MNTTGSIKINARRVVVDSATAQDNACVIAHNGVIVETGPIEALAGVSADKVVDLKQETLLAGFVNAHSHLELSWMKGKARRHSSFTAWIKEILAARATVSRAEILTGAEYLFYPGSIKINARRVVVDSATAQDNACVIAHNGVIVETGPIEALAGVSADKVVDLKQETLLAGFVNAHSHLELSWMKAA